MPQSHNATFIRGASSGQTSIKRRDLACDVKPPPLKNCKDLTMKLEVKYLCPISSSGANFYIYQDAKDAKKSTHQGGNFLDFHGFSCPKSKFSC